MRGGSTAQSDWRTGLNYPLYNTFALTMAYKIRNVPSVSVGLPVYNGGRFLRPALESLLNQSYEDFEIVVSDNASTDDTAAICNEYVRKTARVRYYRNERNLGAALNYNRVFELSSGRYFKWAAHDDMCAPSFLTECVSVLEENPDIILAYPKAVLIDEESRVTAEPDDNRNFSLERPSERLRQFFLSHQGFHPIMGLIRRSALTGSPLIDDYVGADLVLLAHLTLKGKFQELPQRLFLRREHPERSGHQHIDAYSKWWNPDKRARRYFQLWRELWGYIGTIRTAELSVNEKLACWVSLVRWVRWASPRLVSELSKT